jgi:trigger factor
MQVTEILSEGLKHEFKVVLPMADLSAKLDAELVGLKDKVKINGFRPGKVPMSHMKRVYGRSAMGEVLQNAVNEANQKIISDKGLRLALEPKVDFPADQADIEKVIAGEGDLFYSVTLESLPTFEVGTFTDIELTRQVADVTEVDVQETLDRMALQNRTFSLIEDAAHGAQNGEQVTIDFVGKIKGEAFEGGTGEAIDVVIGSNTFIPGFEDQLVGIKAGEERKVSVKFPVNYLEARLAGQSAEFDVTAKAVSSPDAFSITDEFAKGYGFEDLAKMKEAIEANMSSQFAGTAREKVKRALLDALDKRYSFLLPSGLVEQEFANIWRQVEAEQQSSGRSFADDDTTEEAARIEYHAIAERRVRLGLVLAEVGDKSGVKVTDEEVSQALVARARQYPGQEKQVWDFYRQNPERLAEIRAPLFEEKVVDYIIGLAKVTEVKVNRTELFKTDEDEAAPASEKTDEAPKAEKPAAKPKKKKAEAEKSAE